MSLVTSSPTNIGRAATQSYRENDVQNQAEFALVNREKIERINS